MRLFVAAWPPAGVVDLLAALPRPEVAGVRWTPPDQWHVTLRFLGDVDDPAPVVAALAGVGVARGPAVAVLGPAVEALGPDLVVAPVAGLDDVATAVVAATAGFGRPPGARPFRGHLTLGRLRRGARVRARSLGGAPVAASWPVGEVALVRSHLGAGGARYDDVARVALLGPGAGEGA